MGVPVTFCLPGGAPESPMTLGKRLSPAPSPPAEGAEAMGKARVHLSKSSPNPTPAGAENWGDPARDLKEPERPGVEG